MFATALALLRANPLKVALCGLFLALLTFAGWEKLRADHLAGKLEATRADLIQARRDLKTLADTRQAEVDQALQSVTALQAFCTSERSAAVKAGRTIEKGLHASPRPDGSRPILGADWLRDLAAEPATGSLPADPAG
jgi:hypothetical protein